MPLHLDSISRRRFLHGSAALVLTTTTKNARAAKPDSEIWALLSDTHINADPAKISRQGVNMAKHLRRVVAEVVKEKETLSGVIINGDCAYLEGHATDYATFLELLAPLREAELPIHFTLGNHDDRDVFASALGNASQSSPVMGKHCSLIETPLVNWLLLDSLRYVNKVEGEIGTEQLAWVAGVLDGSPDKPTIVMTHHYPQMIPKDTAPDQEKIKISGLVDSEPFLKMLSSHSAAKAYIYGHSHNWKLKRNADGLHEVNLPPTAYVFKKEVPSGWVRATVSDTNLALELRSIDPAHPQHGEQHLLTWR